MVWLLIVLEKGLLVVLIFGNFFIDYLKLERRMFRLFFENLKEDDYLY